LDKGLFYLVVVLGEYADEHFGDFGKDSSGHGNLLAFDALVHVVEGLYVVDVAYGYG
jgi:hypothetical protein